VTARVDDEGRLALILDEGDRAIVRTALRRFRDRLIRGGLAPSSRARRRAEQLLEALGDRRLEGGARAYERGYLAGFEGDACPSLASGDYVRGYRAGERDAVGGES
jgi:hypothetical protein